MKAHHLVMAASCLAGLASAAAAQDGCSDTPEGRVCKQSQAIVGGNAVSQARQKELGLVIINGGCSGTLMNRDWVLTARHCVTNPPPNATAGVAIASPLMPIDQVSITASWSGWGPVTPTRYYDLAVNSGPGAVPTVDMILIHLGGSDFGTVNRQTPYIQQRGVTTWRRWVAARLQTSDTVNQYGQGFSSLATGVFGGKPAAKAATGLGTYRTARFAPSGISRDNYTFVMNASNQVGHGGDSGGPTVITVANGSRYIAGVQSTCVATGYITNAPNRSWQWATGVSSCQYVSVEPYVREIGRVVAEKARCKDNALCAMPNIVEYVIE